MSDSEGRSDEPGLFDLPLHPENEGTEETEDTGDASTTSRPRRRSRSADLPLFPEVDDLVDEVPRAEPVSKPPRPRPVPVPEPEASPEEPEAETPHEEPSAAPMPRRATPGRRWLAGGLDLLTLLGFGLVLGVGSILLGVSIGSWELLPLGLFLLLFSFVYTVIPLAFWGQTPGMIRAGLVARSGPSDPLTFGQTALRWLGSLLTVATLGLPTLLVLFGGRSLTDRLSGSDTWQTPPSGSR